ncbi:MAG: methyltransferase [archaeon]
MIIKVSNDLKKEEIWANGVELASIMGKDRINGKRALTYPPSKKIYVHTFKNPLLTTDNYQISRLNPTLRDTLFALYSNKPRIIEYDGVSVSWDYTHINVWCPSIDTLLFARALKKIFEKRNKFGNCIEIGCGSGFLSKYLLKKSKVKSLLINDINPYAIKCAMDNIKDKTAAFYAGDGLKKIKNHKFDLIICNPPYVPRIDDKGNNPYEGIGLLNHLIYYGQDYLNKKGILVTNISSLCWDVILENKPKMKMKIIDSMYVPLKVNNILNNKKWISYLQRTGLQKKYKKGYEYWHKINIVTFENQ